MVQPRVKFIFELVVNGSSREIDVKEITVAYRCFSCYCINLCYGSSMARVASSESRCCYHIFEHSVCDCGLKDHSLGEIRVIATICDFNPYLVVSRLITGDKRVRCETSRRKCSRFN